MGRRSFAFWIFGPSTAFFAAASTAEMAVVSTVIAIFAVCRGGGHGSPRGSAKASSTRLPEPSSSLLKAHKVYMTYPPHDTSLYDALEVAPNATAAQISKSYRVLTRRFHPDKARQNRKRRSSAIEAEEDEVLREEKFELVRQAFEILKDDKTRIPYHRFGLMDTAQAVLLLTKGSSRGNGSIGTDLKELLLLMGYDDAFPDLHHYDHQQQHRRRVMLIVSRLLEWIRPVVEGRVTNATLTHAVAVEADRLKVLPMGAQIIRCIGRAYRYSGEKYTRRLQREPRQQLQSGKRSAAASNTQFVETLSERVRDGYRDAKHFLTAAVASGRAVMTGNLSNRHRHRSPMLDYHFYDDDVFENEHARVLTEEEIKEQEMVKSQDALLESLQVEALWKISKIDLDRTVREACELILKGEYFFFPSFYSSSASPPGRYKQKYPERGEDGWVSSSSNIAIDTSVGRLRAASCLIMMGDTMVQRSKIGTSWRE